MEGTKETITMGQDAQIDIARVVELGRALTHGRRPHDVFDRPLGVDDDCLSSREIIKILRNGVADDDLRHLMECPTCLENVSRIGSALQLKWLATPAREHITATPQA